jgi:nucleoside triphosphate pyrophosphatase
MRLILASTSPRRREILALLGVPFDVIAPEFDETLSADLSIQEEVLVFAVAKARSVARKTAQSIVIGSDTMIDLDGQKIGKPVDRRDAARILRSLSGKFHSIYTSVAILDSGDEARLTTVEKVAVEMRAYTAEDIDSYLACGESLDKAGAYSLQGEGRRLIKSIRGDYLAAVGMPLKPIGEYLRNRGISCLVDVEKLYVEKSFMNWSAFL